MFLMALRYSSAATRGTTGGTHSLDKMHLDPLLTHAPSVEVVSTTVDVPLHGLENIVGPPRPDLKICPFLTAKTGRPNTIVRTVA